MVQSAIKPDHQENEVGDLKEDESLLLTIDELSDDISDEELIEDMIHEFFDDETNEYY
ncbi:hypothetical protein MM239_11990 [Belliella sp. DSM 111904]|uniref:Uncharacterized protein n=1 Tax=Belliella filtrata TaxID=2923435 RepID=A0ABS9V197_9BACT|nr:hypothetical protein [Belliella filtrata]MCH7410119.1 hypothetical protein [Belliella filtrata]